MSGGLRRGRGGLLLVFLGGGLFVASVVQSVVSSPEPYDIVQTGYVSAVALIIAGIGGWIRYREWSQPEQRRVLVWTLLGGVFLLVLAVLSMLDMQSTNAIAMVEEDFFFLHFATLGCFGGSVTGLYYVRTRKASQRATAERTRAEAVIQHSPLPVTVVDMDGEVVLWNEAAEAVFGYDAEDVRGERSPLVPPDKEGEYDDYLRRLRNGTDVDGLRTRRRCSDGTLLEVELWATPISDPVSDETYAVFVARDLSEIELLSQQRMVLERVLRHNLRNELTVILSHGERIANDEHSEWTQEGETIHAAANRLVDLSEHVARLQRLDEEITSRDISACVADVTEQLRKEYPRATVSVDAPEGARAQTVPLLHDAIHEAVENAIVHTDDPEPHVDVSVGVDEDADYVRVSVADSGPGIPDSEWRPIEVGTEDPLAHSSGLGLWVMRWAAMSSGGHLSRTDRDPTGTTVTFTLPRTVEMRDAPAS